MPGIAVIARDRVIHGKPGQVAVIGKAKPACSGFSDWLIANCYLLVVKDLYSQSAWAGPVLAGFAKC